MIAVRAHPHAHTVVTFDPRFLKCAYIGCESVWKIPVKPAPSVRGRTSEAAARKVDSAAHVQRVAVYQAFQKAGADGMTDAEGQEITGLAGDSYRPRRWQLHKDNLVMDSGFTRKRAGVGLDMIVWRIRE